MWLPCVGHAASAVPDPDPASAPDSVPASAPSTPRRFSLAVSASAPVSVSAAVNGPGSSGSGAATADSPGASAPPPPVTIVDARDVTTAARIARSVTPAYPLAAREEGLEATVKLEIVVDETGRVLSSRVSESAGHGFDEAALQALQSTTFTPARVGARLVRVRMPWSVEFRLR